MVPGVGFEPPRFLGHPLHPATTHLPLGVLTGSVVWDVAALWTGSEIWWRLAWWSLILGLVGAVPTVLTGLLEYASLPEEHPGSGRADLHLVSALSALSLFGASAVLRRGIPAPELLPWAVGASFLGLAALVLTGWSGGDLLIRFGVGIEKGGPESG